jgi:hypothetical protein
MPKKKLNTRPKLTWRDWPESAIRSFPSMPNAASLHPDASTVFAAVCGNPESRAIADSYAFRFPVTIVEVIPCG